MQEIKDLLKLYKDSLQQVGEEVAQKFSIDFLKQLKPKIFQEVLFLLALALKEETLSSQQNKSLHLFCRLLAKRLNESGQEMRHPFHEGETVPWSMNSIKEHVWRPIQALVLEKESTRLLTKREVGKIHEIIMRNMGEKRGIEYIPWPSQEQVRINKLGY